MGHFMFKHPPASPLIMNVQIKPRFFPVHLIAEIQQRSIYGLYIKSAPFFGDLKKFPETKNNSRFYILKLYFLLHYNQFSHSVTSFVKYCTSKLVYSV